MARNPRRPADLCFADLVSRRYAALAAAAALGGLLVALTWLVFAVREAAPACADRSAHVRSHASRHDRLSRERQLCVFVSRIASCLRCLTSVVGGFCDASLCRARVWVLRDAARAGPAGLVAWRCQRRRWRARSRRRGRTSRLSPTGSARSRGCRLGTRRASTSSRGGQSFTSTTRPGFGASLRARRAPAGWAAGISRTRRECS